MEQVSDEELDMIRYFHKEKGDFTRYVEWEKLEPILRKSHPHLFDAIARLESAQKTLDAIIDSL